MKLHGIEHRKQQVFQIPLHREQQHRVGFDARHQIAIHRRADHAMDLGKVLLKVAHRPLREGIADQQQLALPLRIARDGIARIDVLLRRKCRGALRCTETSSSGNRHGENMMNVAMSPPG